MNKKRQTIKKRIIRSSLINVLLPMIILGVFSILVSYGSALEYLGENVRSTAATAAESIRWEIKSYQNIALETGGNKRLTDESISDEEKMITLESISKGYGFERGNLMDSNGDALNGNNYSDRVYFQKAMQGISYVSEPVVSKTTGKISIIVAAPLWKDGNFGSQANGCVYFVPYEEFLNDITRRLMAQVSDNATAYILNKDGTIIANDDANKVKDGINYIQLSQSDHSYSDLAAVNKKMISGESGYMSATIHGNNNIIGFAPIPDSDGWSIAVQAPTSDFMFNTYISMIITVVLIVIAIIIAVFTSIRMGNSIGNPVSVCAERLKLLAQGDIKTSVPNFNTNDEMEILAEATGSLVTDLNEIMSDTGHMLTEMADGNFTVNSEVSEEVYRGDFHVLVDSLVEIKRRLNHTLLQINSAADQVSTGSDQVSSGALALSQGATEQASSIGDLTSFIHTIDERVTQTTESCEEGRRLVGETVDYIGKATEEMHSLTNAMQDINDATEKISKIIKDIEDIAFQTNILSLNAAVEAARAGEAGKGFAVVADEVRNLANKSAEAAHNTTELIERTVAAVANGTNIAAKTSEAVTQVEERSSEVNSIVNNIAEASVEQSGMVKQITGGMEQISNAVQTISATAEESAAASDELSNQAQTLKKLVGAFQLNNENDRTIDLD